MSPDMNFATSEFAYSNSSAEPSYYNTDPARNNPETEEQITYEVNFATSDNPFAGPSYCNTDPARNKSRTEWHMTCEVIGDALSDQVTDYENVQPTPERIYQEINQEARADYQPFSAHYQPLNISRQVPYEGYVKPVSGRC